MTITKMRYWIYLSMFAMVAVNYVDRIVLSIAAPSIMKEYGFSPVEMGYLFSSYIWAYLILLIPLGMLVDKLGARSVGAVTMIVWSGACMATGAATSYFGLFATRLVLGAAEAASLPVGGNIVRLWAPKSERGLASAILNAGVYGGLALGSFSVGWLILSFGWRQAFYICGAVGILAGILWYCAFRNPEQASWLSPTEKALLCQGDKGSSYTKVPGMVALRSLLSNRSTFAIALAQGCAGYTLYFYLTWLPGYLAASRGMGTIQMSVVTAIPYVTTIFICIFLGTGIDRIARRAADPARVRRIAIGVCLILSSNILASPLIVDVRVFVASLCVSLGCVATAMSMNLALANDLLRSESAGLTTSIIIFGGNVFGLAAPIVTGYLVASSLGYTGAFSVAGFLLLLGAVSISFANRSIRIDATSAISPQEEVVHSVAN